MIKDVLTIKDLLIIIMFFAIIYLFYEINNLKKEKIENFDAVSDANNEAITNAVKQIYAVDIEAIRSLSNFANEINKGGKTIPGNLGVSGSLNIGTTKIEDGIIRAPSRYHINTGELLYLLPQDGVIIGKEWGGNGNLLVEGDLTVGLNDPKISTSTSITSEGIINARKGINMDRKDIDIGGGNGIYPGNADGATYDKNNVLINSWWGVGFKDTCVTKQTNIWFDVRTGMINCKGINIVDDNFKVVTTVNNNNGGNINCKGINIVDDNFKVVTTINNNNEGNINCRGINIIDDSELINPYLKIDKTGNIILKKKLNNPIGLYWIENNIAICGLYNNDKFRLFSNDKVNIDNTISPLLDANGTIFCNQIQTINAGIKNYLDLGYNWRVYEDTTKSNLNFSRTNNGNNNRKNNYSFDGNSKKINMCYIKNNTSVDDYNVKSNMLENCNN